MTTTIPASFDILEGYCGPIEWAMLDAPGKPVWRRAVWGPIGPSSEPERMGIVNAGDMRGDIAMRLPLAHPLAMCHAARWLAEQMGMDPGATAPGWAQYTCGEHCCNGETGEMAACTRPVWSLGTDGGFVLFMDCPNPEAWDGEECRHVPGISDLTDPAEALAAACLAVGGAESQEPSHCGACGQESDPPEEGDPTCPRCGREEWIGGAS